MEQKKRSHWFPLTLVIAGLVIGYSAVVFTHDASAEDSFCPVQKAQQHDKTVS